jgi:hypothetical protein
LFLAGLLLLAVAIPVAVQPTQPTWPTLTRQLTRVRPGTALARLIRENQQFTLLRTEEATDRIPIPLWLRVQWRKTHAEFRYSPEDPTGGYPHVLREAWQWMLRHQDLKPAPAEVPVPPRVKRITAGANQRISDGTNRHSESDIRIDFANPLRVIGASNNIDGSGHQAQSYSADGGATWGFTTLPFTGSDAIHSDPTVDWTSDGTAWATTIGINAIGTILALRAYRSTDGGATWSFDSTFSGTQTATDKQMVWVDHSPTSAHRNKIYAIWHNNHPVYINRRSGSPAAWGTPVQVSGTETTGTGIGGDIKTNANGDVFGFWPDTVSRGIRVVKSTNGGASFSTPTLIATTFDSYDIGVPAFASRRALIYVTAGAYRTATKDMVYAAWTDLSGETGCTSAASEPNTSTTSTCKTRIWFSRSSNGGSTWSAPVMINNQSGKNDQFNPWMSVDETNGTVAIMYYDTVGDAGRKKTDVSYQASKDDGATWGTAVKVTTAQTDETAATADSGNQYGDYNGLSGWSGAFFPSWTDRRNNASEEIWTTVLHETPGPSTDVWMQDTGSDTGIEPDPATAVQPMYVSDDIWVRTDATAGPHQNPEYGQTNYIHVRVRNRSSVAATSFNVQVYGAKASTGLAWPATWSLLGTASVASLAASGTTEVSVPWNPPEAPVPPETSVHYCLLTRLVSSQDPMTYPETANIDHNVRFNNNLAWKNVYIVDLAKTKATVMTFIVRNTLEREGRFTLVFREEWPKPAEPIVTRPHPTIEVEPAAELGKRIQRPKFTLANLRRPTAVALPLKKGEEFAVRLRFVAPAPTRPVVRTVNRPLGVPQTITYRLIVEQVDAQTKAVVGGVAYDIRMLRPR